MTPDQTNSYPSNSANQTQEGILGIFPDHDSAEKAYKALETRGYGKDDFNVVMSERTRDEIFNRNSSFENKDMIKENKPVETTNVILKDAAVGAAIGGTVGAVLGAVAALGTSLVIPGAGLIIAGPIATAIAGAGGFGIGGGVIGAVFGFEVPDQHAKIEDGIQSGHILIGVHPRTAEDAEYIEQEWLSIPNVEQVIR